jgi:hypothetical protein
MCFGVLGVSGSVVILWVFKALGNYYTYLLEMDEVKQRSQARFVSVFESLKTRSYIYISV